MIVRSTLARLVMGLAVFGMAASELSAQPLGTFRWQLSPFCNVLTLNVTQTGGIFVLEGLDDRCGNLPASVVGTAFFSPGGGTIGIGLTQVVTPAAPVLVTVELNPATLSGTWEDSAGYSGTFAFAPQAPAPGAPRPSAGLGPRTNLNTAVGAGALRMNAAGGNSNTAIGASALQSNTTGASNVAVGSSALLANQGSQNVAVGLGALFNLATGSTNTAIGFAAGSALVSGSNNIYVRPGSVPAAESATIRIGGGIQDRAFIGGVRGVSTGVNNAVTVVIDSAGQLGTISSTRRTKDDIADLGSASRQIFDLRPVQFRYRQAFADGSRPLQYGLIAEEVAPVLPALVATDETGQPASVKYHVLPTLLLAEVQRLERERAAIESLLEGESRARRAQDAEIAALRRGLEALAARLTGIESGAKTGSRP